MPHRPCEAYCCTPISCAPHSALTRTIVLGQPRSTVSASDIHRTAPDPRARLTPSSVLSAVLRLHIPGFVPEPDSPTAVCLPDRACTLSLHYVRRGPDIDLHSRAVRLRHASGR